MYYSNSSYVLPPIRCVSDGGDGEDVKVSPPDPGYHGVLAQVVHGAVNVGVGPGVGEDRHVGPTVPEPRHRHRPQPGGGRTGDLRHSLVNIGIVISWKILFSLLKFTPDREGKEEAVCKKIEYSPFLVGSLHNGLCDSAGIFSPQIQLTELKTSQVDKV